MPAKTSQTGKKEVKNMTVNEMKKFSAHMDKYFEQKIYRVIPPIFNIKRHIDVLLYEPTEKYPFWKLVTMGASGYTMPKIPNTISRNNEYIMFVDEKEDLNDKILMFWYYKKLIMIAAYPEGTKTHITYAHSLEWENDSPDDEMVGAFIEFPQVIKDAGIVRCKLSMFKTVACLQVVLLTREELDMRERIGNRAFSDFLYPEDSEIRHFLSETHRSKNF